MKRDGKAGQDLEGGLRDIPEGLRDSGRPCRKVLSVAGFLAFIDLFLAGKRFILEGREASLLHGNPSLLQPHGQKCHSPVLQDG